MFVKLRRHVHLLAPFTLGIPLVKIIYMHPRIVQRGTDERFYISRSGIADSVLRASMEVNA